MSPSGSPRSVARPAWTSIGRDKDSTAAGIHGLIVSSAVMAAYHAPGATGLAVTVLVTLLIYWAAERYSRVLAERILDGRRPTWRRLRRQLTRGWALVGVSAVPLVVLVLATLLGTRLDTAVSAALACSTALLALAGWAVGRDGKLSGGERLVSAAVATLFGIGMILLKMLLH